jgi:dienelactone hydrolase
MVDERAALAWLRSQPFVQPDRIANFGYSFGGILTVLASQEEGYCAAVDAAGGASRWSGSASLRQLMTRAVEGARAPLLFFQAENDYSIEPSRELYAAATAAHRDAEIHIYPADPRFDPRAGAGHFFALRDADAWWSDVFGFVSERCGQPIHP